MKVLKYKKIKNKYKVYFDNDTNLDLYEDTILKYNLLLKKDIDNKTIEDMIKFNNKEDIYFNALKYINIKIRSKGEIYKYLKKKNYEDKDIKEIINRLEKEKIINDEIYIRSYIHDKFYLSSDGPLKIKYSLNDMNNSLVENYILEIPKEDIVSKLDKLIDKKIKSTKNYSGNILKMKLINYFSNLGYSKDMIDEIISKKNINNKENGIKEYNKLYNKYSKKYEGYELDRIISSKLYSKGYDYNEIKKDIL